MKAISLLLAAGCCVPLFGQTRVIAQGSVVSGDFAFYWQTRLEPAAPPLAQELGYASGMTSRKNVIFRVMLDRSQRTYFGYQVQVQPQPQGGAFRLAFQALDLDDEALKRIHIDEPAKWTRLQVGALAVRTVQPAGKVPDVVSALDVVVVDLMVNPATGQRIVDYVVLQQPSRSWSFDRFNPPALREFAYPPGAARDFTVEDAALRLVEPGITINGKVDESTDGVRGEVSGAAVWVYIPNHGRFILSLARHHDLGFRKIGEVRGTSLSFMQGADRFSLTSAKPIVASDVAFSLYGLHEPGWKPNYPNADMSAFQMGTTDLAR